MNGAESLVRTLEACGVDVCFTNPGTSEMHIVAALDQTTRIRCVLGLFEGVVTAAADGYARMTCKPACTLLHLGPGLANGLANLHNAERARVPIVNIVGQHAIEHLKHDAPLTSDVEGIARPYSKWLRTSRATSELGRDVADAFAAASEGAGQIATLVVPADISWGEGGIAARLPPIPSTPLPAAETIEDTAKMLRSGVPTAILIGGNALHGNGLIAAGRIAQATGSKLLAPYNFARMERGAGLPVVERMPYVLDQAREKLRPFRQLILAGSAVPVSYFAYPGKDSVAVPADCTVFTLASAAENRAGALEMVAQALQTKQSRSMPTIQNPSSAPTGPITLSGLAAAVAAALPENAIVVDESMTSGYPMLSATQTAPRHDWLANTGGSIGIALPLAVGAAIACPSRRVLCLSADGSGMYTLQALWTMAREKLNVTVVVFANRTYGVLKREFAALGIGAPGPRASDMLDIGRPDLDWVSLARGMGVPGNRVASLEDFSRRLREGFEAHGPTLVEIPL